MAFPRSLLVACGKTWSASHGMIFFFLSSSYFYISPHSIQPTPHAKMEGIVIVLVWEGGGEDHMD